MAELDIPHTVVVAEDGSMSIVIKLHRAWWVMSYCRAMIVLHVLVKWHPPTEEQLFRWYMSGITFKAE